MTKECQNLNGEFQTASLLTRNFRNPVAQISKSAESWVSKPANAAQLRRAADLEIGETAGWEACATAGSPAAAQTEHSS